MIFLRNKKGVQLTLTTVVIAVLVIVVLIVLIMIFTQGSWGFWGALSSCEDRGGTCGHEPDGCIAGGGSVFRFAKCDSGVCCIPEERTLGEP